MSKQQTQTIVKLQRNMESARRLIIVLREEARQDHLMELVRRYTDIVTLLDEP